VPYSLEFIISPASPTTMRAISACAGYERRGSNQPTIHKRRTTNEELEQQSRGAQGVLLSPLPANRHQIVHQPAAAATTTSTTTSFFSCCCFFSFFVARASPPLRVFACAFPYISPSSVASLVVVAGGDCPTHIDIVFLLPITQTPLSVGLDTLSLLASSSLEFAQCG